MKLIFIGSTGVHQTLIAAHIYLGRLHKNDYRLIKDFCDASRDRSGYPVYVGRDTQGTEVYTLGAGKHYKMMQGIIKQLRDLLGCSSSDLMVYPISVRGENLLARVETFPGESYLSPYMAALLLKRQFDRICEEVEAVREKVSMSGGSWG